MMKDEWKTRQTLIERARNPEDGDAWQEFVAYYDSFIRMLLAKLNVSEDDLEDLSQDVLLKLWKSLPEVSGWRGDSKFRTWLGSVIRNTVFTHGSSTASRKRRDAQSAAPNEVPPALDSLIEDEWREHVIRIVIKRLDNCFSGKAMTVFMMTLDGKPTDEIASSLELTKDSVYVLRNRVRSRFLIEAKQLRRQLEFRE